MVESSPTVRRRELGAVLRGLRTGKGLTVDQVAEVLMCSSSKVSRMETGQRGATLRDVRDLCDLYGVTDQAERDRLMTLAKEGKQQSWWQAYDLPQPYSTYVGLEAEAIAIKDYDSAVVPGLLQTPEYARARHEGALPRLSSEAIEQRVEAMLTRQKQLESPRLQSMHVVLDEAVLHRVIGTPGIMQAQLQQLADKARSSTLTVQIITFNAGVHPALDSTFNILDFEKPVPSVVYVEGLVGQLYLEKAEDINRYRRIFERLCDMSLTPKESIELIIAKSRDYKSD